MEKVPEPGLEGSRFSQSPTVRLLGRKGVVENVLDADRPSPTDVPVPGFKTTTTNNLRLWQARPKVSFDLASFNAGDYDASVREAELAETITRVLYPNDNTEEGKKLRLKQQWLWTGATLSDICRRFRKLGKPWSEFPDYTAIRESSPSLYLPHFPLLRVPFAPKSQT